MSTANNQPDSMEDASPAKNSQGGIVCYSLPLSKTP